MRAKLGIEGGADEMQAFRKAGQAVDLLGPRIEIMFGRGRPVSTEFAACLEAVDRVAGGAGLMSGSGDAVDFRPYWNDIDEGLREARAAHERFLEAAHDAAGCTNQCVSTLRAVS